MYKRNIIPKTTLKVNESYEGETIEQKINRVVNNKEPIKDGAPIIYTERKDGVKPEFDIRTDRFEIAVDAMTTVAKTHKAKREENIGARAKKNQEKEEKSQKTTEKGLGEDQGKNQGISGD